VDVLNSYLYFTDKIIITKSKFTASEGITLKDAAQNGNSALLEGGVYSLRNGKYQWL
jgi:hypothetical protein